MKAPRSAEYSQINIPTRGLRVQQAHLEESDEDISLAKVASAGGKDSEIAKLRCRYSIERRSSPNPVEVISIARPDSTPRRKVHEQELCVIPLASTDAVQKARREQRQVVGASPKIVLQ